MEYYFPVQIHPQNFNLTQNGNLKKLLTMNCSSTRTSLLIDQSLVHSPVTPGSVEDSHQSNMSGAEFCLCETLGWLCRSENGDTDGWTLIFWGTVPLSSTDSYHPTDGPDLSGTPLWRAEFPSSLFGPCIHMLWTFVILQRNRCQLL